MNENYENQPLSAREFYKGIERVECRFDARFDNVDRTLSETRERLAVVEAFKAAEIAEVAKIAKENVQHPSKAKAAGWSMFATGVAMGIIEAIKLLK